MNVDFNYSDCTKVGCNIARDGMQFNKLSQIDVNNSNIKNHTVMISLT
jgi:hypothetical protein